MAHDSIFDFLNTVQDNQLRKKFKADRDRGQPLELVLKDYFESNECINIDHGDQKLTLSFDIFRDKKSWSMRKSIMPANCGGSPTLPRINIINDQNRPNSQNMELLSPTSLSNTPSADERQANTRDYWFLHLLATEKILEPLSKHPYITAFLDLHYSVVEKARSQMKDSVPHLALMILLLELSSTMGGRLCTDHENIFILAVPFFLMVATFDIISLVGLGTSLFDKVLSGSQVRDRERKGVCLPSKKLPCFEQAAQVFSNVIQNLFFQVFEILFQVLTSINAGHCG